MHIIDLYPGLCDGNYSTGEDTVMKWNLQIWLGWDTVVKYCRRVSNERLANVAKAATKTCVLYGKVDGAKVKKENAVRFSNKYTSSNPILFASRSREREDGCGFTLPNPQPNLAGELTRMEGREGLEKDTNLSFRTFIDNRIRRGTRRRAIAEKVYEVNVESRGKGGRYLRKVFFLEHS